MNSSENVRPFHKRFDIDVPLEEAQKRFINRILGSLPGYLEGGIDLEDLRILLGLVAFRLGEPRKDVSARLGSVSYAMGMALESHIKEDFHRCLQVIESVYRGLDELTRTTERFLSFTYRDGIRETMKQVDTLVNMAVRQSETDIGVVWQNHCFFPSGAKLLDEVLVNESMRWLDGPQYTGVLAPFTKGLEHYMESHRYPERLGDVVTDMYEAVEALAKRVTGKNRDLSGNRELFIAKLRLSDYYKKILRDYIAYANEYRHATAEGKQRPLPERHEVEAFVYMTGLFIRLAIQSLETP